jgi:putative transcriptional regulator
MTNTTPLTNLENQFLIAMPQLQDSFFAGTVTYMWKHSADGALGIDIFDELSIVFDREADKFAEQKVLAGGPVERDKGFILHNSSKSWKSSVPISNEISLCTSRTILEDIANGEGPENYVIALGCAGWDAGQLEREIAENSWLTAPAKSELLFSNHYRTMASLAAAQLGINLNQIPPEAGHS